MPSHTHEAQGEQAGASTAFPFVWQALIWVVAVGHVVIGCLILLAIMRQPDSADTWARVDRDVVMRRPVAVRVGCNGLKSSSPQAGAPRQRIEFSAPSLRTLRLTYGNWWGTARTWRTGILSNCGHPVPSAG